MSTEYSSGIKIKDGDQIKGYQIVKTFDSGAFAFAAKAKTPTGRSVFFKKYKRPGGASPWLAGFIAYQTELKRRIQSDAHAKALCYEFIEFFEMKKTGGAVPLKAFYQVFEWVEGGKDLRKVFDELETNPAAYDWKQRVIFSRVMLAGINAIHKAGVIHTDIKPENFYLLPEPTILAKYKLRVIDMDFSILEGKQAPWHGHEGYVGTPGYMSPEHIAGNIVPSKPSDVFTLGLIIGELLGAGHPAAPSMDTYDDQVKEGRLKPVVIQKPIEGVADLKFLSFVVNGSFRPEPNRRPTVEQLLLALNGRLPEWDGKREGGPGGDPGDEDPPPPAVIRVELSGPAGQKIRANISTKFGRDAFRSWGDDYQRFLSPEQFYLSKDASGKWMIEHCAAAANMTNADGRPIVSRIPVEPGMTITLGKTSKCPIVLNLCCQLVISQ